MIKEFIKNRKGEKICVVFKIPNNPKGTAIIMHGNSGRKEQKHIKEAADAFYEKNITAIRFDTRHTKGESEFNSFENATLTNYYEDLETVYSWAKKQDWFTKPIYICGHSLGGISTILFSINHPETKAAVPMSPVISGDILIKCKGEKVKEWDRTGWKTSISITSGKIKKQNWTNYKKDILQYDLMKQIDEIKVPQCIIVGDKDDTTPAKYTKEFYDALKVKKEFHLIKDGPHTFIEEEQIEEIKTIIKKWIDKINKKGD